jgi:cyanate permease
VPPLSTWLIGAFGWRDAVAILATGAAAIALPVFALCVVRRPEDVGQLPDGRRPSGLGGPAEPPPERGAREVLADPNFWLIGLGIALALCVPVSFLFLVRHMEALGIQAQRISWLIASMSVLSLLAKLAAGWLCDRIGERRVAVGVPLLYAAGWVVLALGAGFPAMLAGCAVVALGGGALTPLPPMLVGACFGRGMVGRVAGLHAPLGLPFLISAAPLVGLARDRTGDYVVPFLALAGVLVLAALVLSFVRVPGARRGRAPLLLRADPGSRRS